MRKQTTTQKLLEVVTTNLMQITKAEIYYKYANKVDVVSPDTFKESLEYLNESGIFSNMIDWHYEENRKSEGEYIFDSGRSNGYSDIYIVACLSVNDDVNVEDIERTLEIVEE